MTALPNTPLPHQPIIPVGNMQNGRMEIPYYQQSVKFPLHLIKKEFFFLTRDKEIYIIHFFKKPEGSEIKFETEVAN
jgi:hypothetical protein